MSQEAKVGAEHAGSAVQDVLSALENVLLLLGKRQLCSSSNKKQAFILKHTILHGFTPK